MSCLELLLLPPFRVRFGLSDISKVADWVVLHHPGIGVAKVEAHSIPFFLIISSPSSGYRIGCEFWQVRKLGRRVLTFPLAQTGSTHIQNTGIMFTIGLPGPW